MRVVCTERKKEHIKPRVIDASRLQVARVHSANVLELPLALCCLIVAPAKMERDA